MADGQVPSLLGVHLDGIGGEDSARVISCNRHRDSRHLSVLVTLPIMRAGWRDGIGQLADAADGCPELRLSWRVGAAGPGVAMASAQISVGTWECRKSSAPVASVDDATMAPTWSCAGSVITGD
jgi:hypothetical protein